MVTATTKLNRRGIFERYKGDVEKAYKKSRGWNVFQKVRRTNMFKVAFMECVGVLVLLLFRKGSIVHFCYNSISFLGWTLNTLYSNGSRSVVSIDWVFYDPFSNCLSIHIQRNSEHGNTTFKSSSGKQKHFMVLWCIIILQHEPQSQNEGTSNQRHHGQVTSQYIKNNLTWKPTYHDPSKRLLEGSWPLTERIPAPAPTRQSIVLRRWGSQLV